MSLNTNVGLQGFNTNTASAGATTNPALPQLNTPFNNSIFNLQAPAKDYSQDLMMPDFLKTNTAQTFTSTAAGTTNPPSQSADITQQTNIAPQTQNIQTQNNTVQTPAGLQNNITFQQDLTKLQAQINQQIAQQSPEIGISEKGNLYKTSNNGKKLGLFGGLVAPVATGAYALTKGAKISKAFNLKNLLIKCPLVGVAGLAIGAIADYFINRYRASKADSTQQA